MAKRNNRANTAKVNSKKPVNNANKKKTQPGVKKRLGTSQRTRKGGVADARQKIMSKNRKNVVDARDVLAKMAKGQDARGKLQKMRERGTRDTMSSQQHIRAIGANIIRKTDHNGKISLVTNKAKQQQQQQQSSSGMHTNMNIAIQQQLGILPQMRRALPKKVIAKNQAPMKVQHMRSPPSRQPLAPAFIRKTIRNNYTPAALPQMPEMHHRRNPYDMEDAYYSSSQSAADMYKWHRKESTIPYGVLPPPVRMPRSHLNEPTSGEWITYSHNPPTMRSAPMPSTYIDLDAMDDDEMPLVSQATVRPRVSSIHSRLDGSTSNNTHGILSQTKTKVVVPVGHRIVVSNLQSTVTQDDIRELFEDIGQLLVARLVRPGTAEVIYKNLKDAQKAVDTYHNRQLDGQPMKCLLVNKRPANNPTAPPIQTTSISAALRNMPAVSAANKLVPDISTIHKVLFQRN